VVNRRQALVAEKFVGGSSATVPQKSVSIEAAARIENNWNTRRIGLEFDQGGLNNAPTLAKDRLDVEIMRRRSSYSSRPARSVLLCVLGGAALLVSACAAPGSSIPAAVADTAAVGVASAAAPGPLDPLAPAAPVLVMRNGKKSYPTIKGSVGKLLLSVPARYPDGVTVSVDRVAARVEHGKGPGVFPSRPYLLLSLAIANGSTSTIDLNQVVVTIGYGSPTRLAAPVYEDPAANDFSGRVAPGAARTATYLFAVPVAKRAGVVATVDFDNSHIPAMFRGGI